MEFLMKILENLLTLKNDIIFDGLKPIFFYFLDNFASENTCSNFSGWISVAMNWNFSYTQLNWVLKE